MFSLILGVNNKIVVLVQCVHKMTTKTVKKQENCKRFATYLFILCLKTLSQKQLVNILQICENSSGMCFHIPKTLPTLNSNVNKLVLNHKKFFQIKVDFKKNTDKIAINIESLNSK